MLTVTGKQAFSQTRSPLRLPRIDRKHANIKRHDLIDGDMNYLRRKNLTADDSKKRISLLISKKEKHGFRGPGEGHSRVIGGRGGGPAGQLGLGRGVLGAGGQMRGGYGSVSVEQKRSIKIDDLMQIQGVSKVASNEKAKPSTEQDAVAREFLKAKGYKLKEIQQSREADSFVDTTESTASMKQALAHFNGIYSLKSVQMNYKESTMLLGVDLKPTMADMFEDILAIGIVMLKFDTYPSVYFITDIWRSLLFIVSECIKGKSTIKETLIKEVFDSLKVYIKLEKIHIQSDLQVISEFFSKLYPSGNQEIRAIDVYAVKGFVQFVAWILGHLEATYFDDHCYIRHLSLSHDYSNIFQVSRQVMVNKSHESTFSKPWLEWIARKCYTLLFDCRISESIILNADSHWSTVVFDLILSIMNNPNLSVHLVSKWQLEADQSRDMDISEDQEEPHDPKYQKLIELLDLLLGFTGRALTDQKQVKKCSGLISNLAKILEKGVLLPEEDMKQAHFLEIAVLSKMNMLVFDIARGLKEKIMSHAIFPFLDSLIDCSAALIKRVQGKDKRVCQQVVRNGIHELLTVYKSANALSHDKQEIEALEIMVKKIIGAKLV